MDIDLWFIYFTTVVVLCLTPGPNSMLALANGARYGLGCSIFSTLGGLFGFSLLTAVAISGLGVILTASYTAFVVIKWLGVAYLLYLGINLIISKQSVTTNNQHKSFQSAKPKPFQLFLQGLIIILTNPKVLIFFMAFLSQFIDQNASMFNQYLVLTGTFVAIELVIEILLALFAEKLNRQFSKRGFVNAFNTFTGGVFILAAVYLIGAEKNN